MECFRAEDKGRERSAAFFSSEAKIIIFLSGARTFKTPVVFRGVCWSQISILSGSRPNVLPVLVSADQWTGAQQQQHIRIIVIISFIKCCGGCTLLRKWSLDGARARCSAGTMHPVLCSHLLPPKGASPTSRAGQSHFESPSSMKAWRARYRCRDCSLTLICKSCSLNRMLEKSLLLCRPYTGTHSGGS